MGLGKHFGQINIGAFLADLLALSLVSKQRCFLFIYHYFYKKLMPCPSKSPKQFWSVQNGFGLTKIDLVPTIMIWSWPKWIGRDQNESVTTKMNWSGPNCDFCIRDQNHHWKLGYYNAICWKYLGLFSKIEPDFSKIS